MNPFNNNTQNLSQGDLSKRKRLESINMCCKKKEKKEKNIKLKIGNASINNIYDKKNETILKTWNSNFTDISSNNLHFTNENLFFDQEYYGSFIEIDFNKKVLQNKY
tara:strand:- start:682 stop:1002 length:321 start_codon:yes stop_codon:yes gene_type:complete